MKASLCEISFTVDSMKARIKQNCDAASQHRMKWFFSKFVLLIPAPPLLCPSSSTLFASLVWMTLWLGLRCSCVEGPLDVWRSWGKFTCTSREALCYWSSVSPTLLGNRASAGLAPRWLPWVISTKMDSTVCVLHIDTNGQQWLLFACFIVYFSPPVSHIFLYFAVFQGDHAACFNRAGNKTASMSVARIKMWHFAIVCC